MRTLLSIAIMWAVALPVTVFSSCVLAQDGELSLPTDQRIKLLMYDDSDVYTITTKYGYQTNIVFDRIEEIQTISVGDRSLWQIIPNGNRIFIRPMEDGITTNMTVLTSKRSYQFDLKSVAADQTEGNIYVARFIYPDNAPKPAPAPEPEFAPPPGLPAMPPAPPVAASPPPSATDAPTQPFPAPVVYAYQPPPAEPAPVAAPVPMTTAPATPAQNSAMVPEGTNYSYTYTGPDAVAPLQVYDNGRATYIKYIRQPLPNLYIAGPNGQETPVSYTVQGDFLVVDAVAGEMILKHSDGTVRIFNEQINPN